MSDIFFAENEPDIRRCFPVMVELRTELTEDEFLRKVRRQQEFYGYKLVYLEDEGEVKTVAGIRIAENLAWKRFLYVDDLVTRATARFQGYANTLFEWLLKYAQEEGCNQLELDSGLQRFDAHRFYMNKEMTIVGHHFSLNVNKKGNI